MNEDIFVAKIIGTHGLRGAFKVKVEDENGQRFSQGRRLYLGSEKLPVTVKSYRSQGLVGILQLEEISDINVAEPYLHQEISVPEEELPVPEPGMYYVKDLLGLTVIDEEGHRLGRLKEVLSYASNDVYVLADPSGREYLIPAIKEVIKEVRLDEESMIIRPMEGMFDED